MNYQELEFTAACAVGAAAASVCGFIEYVAGYGVIEIAFSAVCLFVIGAGLFIQISDHVDANRKRRQRRRHKMKQIDFTVGRTIPGSDYVEVVNR